MNRLETPPDSRTQQGESARMLARVLLFLVLVPLVSIPFYVLNRFDGAMALPFGLPISALMVVVPAAVASLLLAQDYGGRAVAALWRRLGDLKRAPRLWVAVGILLMPTATLLAIALADGPLWPLPLESLPVMLLLYLPGAALEEIGWTGYATRPLQARLGIAGAGLLIGAVWALWHVIPWAMAQEHTWSWVAGQSVATVLMRMIMGAIYARGGSSLALAVLFHASINIAYSLVPDSASYDPWLLSLVLAVPMIALLWKRP